MKSLILALALMLGGSAMAANIEVYKFEDPEQEEIYKDLIGELRCLVCQNQNIADSNAELAQDMRRKTYELVKAGKDKGEVADFMAERYGDFVLYKPPFNATTALLWVGPFLLFFIAIWLMLRTIRARRADNETATLSQEQLNEASQLLDKDKKSS
jgi:cytochrome c-type biogenesis protein CcmH